MLGVIIKKELKRVFTDRRLVFSSFILPALSIYLIYTLLGGMIGNMSNDIKEHIPSVVYVNAPETFVTDYSAIMGEREFDASFEDTLEQGTKDAVLNGDMDLIVEFPDGFDEAVKNYESSEIPDIKTYYNPSEDYSSAAKSVIEGQILSAYQNKLLEDRFGDVRVISAFSLNETNEDTTISDEAKEAGSGLSFMLPMLLNLMLFAGAMGIGMDVIAGEKERGTMATMLMTPVKRQTIALGKVISLGIIATISAACTFGAIIASLPSASNMLAGGGDINVSQFAFGIQDYLMLLIVLVVQVGMFVGLICLLSVLAKSVKEAGTYVTPIYMLVMVASFMTVFTSGDVEMYKFAVPVLGNVFAMKEILTFDLSMTEFFLTTGVSVVVIGVLLWAISKAFDNEKVMLNQ